jgi:glycosyltransferase involved in cell wall biosynthesis
MTMNKKNILFLTWKDLKHPNKWWAEKVIYEYAKNLVDLWHNVTWVSSWSQWLQSDEIMEWVNIIRIYSIKTIYFLAWKWYRDYIKTNKVDIIIDEAGWLPLFSPFFAKNKKIFFMAHHIWDKEWDLAFIKPFNYIWKYIMKKIFRVYKNHKTITVSDSTKDELVKDLWFKSENIKVIENALDINPIENIDFLKKKDSIIFLGRLMPMKRIEDSIRAFAEFYKTNKKYELNIVWIAQNKKYTQGLHKLVKNLWLEYKINFVWYSKEIFDKYLETSKVMLVPSYKEWFWLIVLEANAYWLPVIWYDVWWLRDSIKEWINWFKVADWDYIKMWEKLDEILKNDEEYNILANKSLEYVKWTHSWKEKVNDLEKFILE